MRPLRNPGVQSMLAALLAAYLGLTLKTMRWRSQGQADAETIWDQGGGVIVCFWHGRIALAPACWPRGRAQPPKVLISLSPDGGFIAKAMERLGFPAIRGSSLKPTDPAKAKGGAQAFRETLRWLKSGGGIAITPDGPRGPAESMGDGPRTLAEKSRAPVLLVGMAAAPALRLNSWDRTLLPLPFGRGALVWRRVEPGDDWSAELSELTRRAEALVG